MQMALHGNAARKKRHKMKRSPKDAVDTVREIQIQTESEPVIKNCFFSTHKTIKNTFYYIILFFFLLISTF